MGMVTEWFCRLRHIFLLPKLLALFACGSGGGSSDSGPGAGAAAPPPGGTPQTAPVVVLDRSTGIMGVDADKNGIRDDINLLISKIGTPEQKPALNQVALAIQVPLSSSATTEAATKASKDIDKALGCL